MDKMIMGLPQIPNQNACRYAGKPFATQKLLAKPQNSDKVLQVKEASAKEKKGKVHSLQVLNTQLTVLPNNAGATLEFLLGIRISLPFIGSGFNICIGSPLPTKCPPCSFSPATVYVCVGILFEVQLRQWIGSGCVIAMELCIAGAEHVCAFQINTGGAFPKLAL